MKTWRGLSVYMLAVLALGSRCDVPVEPVRPKPVDAGTPADCAAACAHMRKLGCEEGKPTPKGATCEDVCNNVEASGTITLHPACVVKIERCDQVESCAY